MRRPPIALAAARLYLRLWPLAGVCGRCGHRISADTHSVLVLRNYKTLRRVLIHQGPCPPQPMQKESAR